MLFMKTGILLGTALARPLIAKKQIEVAHKQKDANAVAQEQQEKAMTR